MARRKSKTQEPYWQPLDALPKEDSQLTVKVNMFPSDLLLLSALLGFFKPFGWAWAFGCWAFVAMLAAQFITEVPGNFMLNNILAWLVGWLGSFAVLFLGCFAYYAVTLPKKAEGTLYTFYRTYFTYYLGDDRPAQAIPYDWIEGISIKERKHEQIKRLGYVILAYKPGMFPGRKKPPMAARKIINVREVNDIAYRIEKLIDEANRA